MKSTFVRAGVLTTVQNGARTGSRGIGVSSGGALDLFALEVLNSMAGNDRLAAGLEIVSGVVRLTFADKRLVAWGGGEYEVKAGATTIPAGHAAIVTAGEELQVSGPRQGFRAWLAVSGGFDVPAILGSRSTDGRGKFGGWEGRALRDGDCIPLNPNPPETEQFFARIMQSRISNWAAPFGWTHPAVAASVLRVVQGSEWDSFLTGAHESFLKREFVVASESDRMGVRLTGPQLLSVEDEELVSEPVVPGTIQVPASGDPILLLGDCQTIGGYAKLAHVITVDLPRAAQLRPGDSVRFRQVSLEEARAALSQRARDFNFFRAGLGLTNP